MTTLPEIQKKDCTWDVLQLFCRRAETRCQTILSDFNKFSLRLSNQSNTIQSISNINANSVQDIGYWENETVRRESEMNKTLTLYTTLVSLVAIYPNPLPGQEFANIIQYIEPYVDGSSNGDQNGRNNNSNTPQLNPTLVVSTITTKVQQHIDNNDIFTQPSTLSPSGQNNGNNGTFQYQPITSSQSQLTFSRRCMSILTDITMDFLRSKELCQSALNRMYLFAPNRDSIGNNDNNNGDNNNNNNNDYYNEDGDDNYNNISGYDDYTDSDTDCGSDVEAQLIQHEKKFGSKYNNKNNKNKTRNNQNNNNNNQNTTKNGSKLPNTNSTNDNSHNLLTRENRLIREGLQQSQLAINSAVSSQDSMNRQRDMFNNIISRVGVVISKFPGMTNAMNAIQNKRHRDNCILATLIAFLIFITFIYLHWKHTS